MVSNTAHATALYASNIALVQDETASYVIHADLELDSTVDDELLVRVDRAWNSDDQSFCSSADRHRANVLSLSFDVDAGTYKDAARRAREAVVALASDLQLSGRLVELKAYTEAGWLDASPTE